MMIAKHFPNIKKALVKYTHDQCTCKGPTLKTQVRIHFWHSLNLCVVLCKAGIHGAGYSHCSSVQWGSQLGTGERGVGGMTPSSETSEYSEKLHISQTSNQEKK